jgi:hypothetical protein
MNQFHTCVNELKSIFDLNYDVNTVVFGLDEDRDLYKKSIYPLVQINPTAAPWDTSSIDNGMSVAKFTFEIAALDQRNISKQSATEKFDGNDDLQDNLNVTYTILNDMVTRLSRGRLDSGMQIESISSALPILFKDHNLLDGWYVTITVQIPNTQWVC